jgi:hypothetical protein
LPAYRNDCFSVRIAFRTPAASDGQ